MDVPEGLIVIIFSEELIKMMKDRGYIDESASGWISIENIEHVINSLMTFLTVSNLLYCLTNYVLVARKSN